MAERRVQRPRWYVGDSCQSRRRRAGFNRLARNQAVRRPSNRIATSWNWVGADPRSSTVVSSGVVSAVRIGFALRDQLTVLVGLPVLNRRGGRTGSLERDQVFGLMGHLRSI